MDQETVYRVATAVAAAITDEKQPEQSWLHTIAWQLKQSGISKRKTFEAFLRGFDQPRLLRLVSRVSRGKEPSPFPEPPGKTVTLYKPFLPGETQARLAYECFLDGFLSYLQRTYCVCTLRETPASVTLFVPQRKTFGLEDAWQKYIQDAFSRRGLTESFVLLLNSVQLAGRGFGVLDVPLVSREQQQVLAGFYLAAVPQVEKRLHSREGQIREAKEKLAQTSLTEKERTQSEKKLKILQDKQKEEIEKYRDDFAKKLSAVLTKEEKLLQKTTGEKASQTKSAKRRAKSSGGSVEADPFTFRKERIRPMRELLRSTSGDPFLFLRQDQAARQEIFESVLRVTASFTEQARKQLNTSRGDIFASLIVEVYRLLDGNVPLTRISPLFSSDPLPHTERSAGDASGKWCYSCGRSLDDEDNSAYEVRRLLFSSPNQRSQSGVSSSPPKACSTCAAIALTCPLKLSDQNVIVRLDPEDQTAGTADSLRHYCRMLTIGTLNTSAGRYLSLVCTESRVNKGKREYANNKFGGVVYVVAKLALELPSDVFREFLVTLIVDGSEIFLDPAILFSAAGFLHGYNQWIMKREKGVQTFNFVLGETIRYLQQGRFYAAEYIIISKDERARPSRERSIYLEQHRKNLWEFLKMQAREKDMNKNAEQRAKFYGDVAALTGLLYGFCGALKYELNQDSELNKKEPKQKEKEIGRVISKAIEYVDDSPAFFTYTAITNNLPSESARLYKDPQHHFLYERGEAILAELGWNDRERQDGSRSYLQLYFDDITKAYTYFSKPENYGGEREWKEFLYQVKLSLYSRFPECFSSIENKNK